MIDKIAKLCTIVNIKLIHIQEKHANIDATANFYVFCVKTKLIATIWFILIEIIVIEN
jgi:hypothetical protein